LQRKLRLQLGVQLSCLQVLSRKSFDQLVRVGLEDDWAGRLGGRLCWRVLKHPDLL
jgi:hypothetical protein